ncbi:hypothetical protein GLE_0032 [Lysobacter enzymogenes]|uniref:Uncharacterized protein n=1 Tax=Lysobacter enzymogenes TaxID=69 RepID=A0A0S2DAC7_LYSEN|nr:MULTISPECIES: hypothetical protein [Lysobacter]ALN55391.1 hypothetical protein GLE_0032 [Lysobacter enzymogenes]QCW24477.1 hypothetical protein FE772_01095 [Lysobacter enzymogenes]SDZ19905.1 hypothetical protein SAMN04487939_12218 [Lysobacter sp. yr284]
MAYTTAIASDPNELLDKLRVFAQGNGWSVDGWRDRTVKAGKALSVHADSLFVTFLSELAAGDSARPGPFVGAFGHTGYATHANADVQAEASGPVWANYAQGPYSAVHFFGRTAPQPYLHVVLETQAGTFKHFGTGRLVTRGIVNTGQYVYGSQWYYDDSYVNSPDDGRHAIAFDDSFTNYLTTATRVRADYDGMAPRWHAVSDTGSDPRALYCGWRRRAAPINLLKEFGHSTLTGRAPGQPLWCAVPRGGDLSTDVGHPPDLRFIRLDSYAPGEELVLGSDRWKMFPVHRKNGPVGTPNSGVYGYAYRITE